MTLNMNFITFEQQLNNHRNLCPIMATADLQIENLYVFKAIFSSFQFKKSMYDVYMKTLQIKL